MRILVALYGLALAVRALLVALHPDAAYVDSYYYVNVARSLFEGHGFNIDFIWGFVDVGGRIPANPSLPIPSNAHWMPLASIVQLPTMALLGPTPLASAIPFAVIGALAAPLTWLIARDLGARSSVAMGAAVMVAIPAAATVFMAQPDNFSLYQPLGAASLWLAARGLKGDNRSFALAGLCVGLATLARNDGIFLGAAVAAAFFWSRWRSRSSLPESSRRPRISWQAALLCAGLFAIVMAPWYARELSVFGSFSPSSSSGRVLWIQTYAELNSVTSPTSISAFLSQGIGPLVVSRVLGFVSAVSIYAVLVCALALVPFVAAGAWSRRRSVDFGPFFVYAGLLFAAAGLLFAVHVPYGTFLHSAVALVPHSYILALEGVVIVVAWVSRHRRTWQEAEATRVFLAGAVGLSILTAVAYGSTAYRAWDRDESIRQATGIALDRVGAPNTDLLLSADPGGYDYFTGHGGIVTPDDPIDVVKEAGEAYRVRWLVLERQHIVPAMVPVLKGESRPSWIGAPIYTSAAFDGVTDGIPDVAVYPVCFSATDTRCGSQAQR